MTGETHDPYTGDLANVLGSARFEKADYLARCFVQGTKRGKLSDGTYRIGIAVGDFDARFHHHPWVRDALAEGWDRDLRQHIISVVKFRLLKGEFLKDMTAEELMPEKHWADAWRQAARKHREAAEWRAGIEAEYGSVDTYLSKTAHRRGSANSAGASAKKVVATLTSRSLAMTGEAQ